MASMDELLQEFDAAFKAEFQTAYNGHIPESVKSRLNEATRLLHAAEDPWSDCLCHFCADAYM